MPEDGELRTAPLMIRLDQIARIDRLKARLQALRPQSISRSNVVRDALDLALPAMEKAIDEKEAEAVAGVA